MNAINHNYETMGRAAPVAPALEVYDFDGGSMAIVRTATEEGKAIMRGMFDLIPSRPVVTKTAEERLAFRNTLAAEITMIEAGRGGEL